jgi:uncharacterized iron-regulated membrane protein
MRAGHYFWLAIFSAAFLVMLGLRGISILIHR